MDKPEPPPCNHAWRRVRDWYGDPGVINGTCDVEFWRCRHCGDETDAPGADEYCVPDWSEYYDE